MVGTIKDIPSLFLDRCIIMFRRLIVILAMIITSSTTILAQCNGVVYDSGGSSGAYGTNEESIYVYSAQEGSVMELTFNSFDLEQNYDYLYIYDGANSSAPLMYTLIGTTPPSVITSTGKDITLKFVSDYSVEHEGWEISLSCYSNTNCNTVPTNGFIAYYNFKETAGNVVHDVSDYGTPLNMTISDPANVTWNSGCASDGNTSVTVGSEIPVAITGDTDICIGYTSTLSPTAGGIWVSHNTNIATVSNSGIVKALAPGKVTFEFIDASSGCTSSGITDEITIQDCLNHDFNVAVVNEAVTGNLNTNDNISISATYSNSPILMSKPSGSLPVLTINSNGSYSFVSGVEGKYEYPVPVCLPLSSSGCPKSIFEISVVDNIYEVSNPVSNLEFASTFMGADETIEGVAIAIKSLENDACVYTGGCGLDPGTVSIIDTPSNGSTAINTSGVITYTPNAGFVGKDTLEYQVCINGGSKCSNSVQVVTVNHNTAVNSTISADDFGFALRGEHLLGNALNNDSDPEGDDITVIPAGSWIAPIAINGGSYYIDATGDYVFTPDDDFVGSTEIVYTICDNNVESICTDATIHILIFDYMTLSLRVYLEGAMMQNGGAVSSVNGLPLMRDDFRISKFTGENIIPMIDSYTVVADQFMNTPFKYNHLGPGLIETNLEITDSLTVMSVIGDDAIVDWVHIELRSKDDMTLPIATRSGLLQRDGDVVDLDGSSNLKFQGVNVDSFYVVVKHRSHLGAMSMKVSNMDLIDFTSLDFPTYDFGTSLGNGNDYTGMAQKNTTVSGYNVLWAGDFDSNGKIKFTNPSDDQNVMFIDVLFNSPNFLINYDSAHGYLTEDYNMDGKVKFTNPSDDLNYLFSQLLLYPNNSSFLSNFNSFIEQIPE